MWNLPSVIAILAMTTWCHNFRLLPASARAINPTPPSARSLDGETGQKTAALEKRKAPRSVAFMCGGELPDQFRLAGLQKKFDAGYWSRADFPGNITQMCNFENVGCYCEDPGTSKLNATLNCLHPVPMRQELNVGDPAEGIEGMRDECMSLCSCPRVINSIKMTLLKDLYATSGLYKRVLGSVRRVYGRSAANPPPLVYNSYAEEAPFLREEDAFRKTQAMLNALTNPGSPTDDQPDLIDDEAPQIPEALFENEPETGGDGKPINPDHPSDSSSEEEEWMGPHFTEQDWSLPEPDRGADGADVNPSVPEWEESPWGPGISWGPEAPSPEYPGDSATDSPEWVTGPTGDGHWLERLGPAQSSSPSPDPGTSILKSSPTGDLHWQDIPPEEDTNSPSNPGSTCALPAKRCFRAGTCLSSGPGCSTCFVPQPPRIRPPPRRPPGVRQQPPRMAAICGKPPMVRAGFRRDLWDEGAAGASVPAGNWSLSDAHLPEPTTPHPTNVTQHAASIESIPPTLAAANLTHPLPPPPVALDDGEALCPCNCSFVHSLCCKPDVIQGHGVIPDATVVSEGIIVPEQGECCNLQTGDMEPLPAGKQLIGNNTLCP